MIIIRILYWIAFIVAMICFPAAINVDVRRAYGRIFQTRIDTMIYRKICYGALACVYALFIVIIMG